MSKGYILGISCGYHDSAASLIKDGKVLGAVEEERFTGIKHDSSFPLESIKWLYSQFKVNKDDVDAICFYETPDLKLDRIETSTKRGGIWEYFTRRKIISRNKTEYKKLDTLLNVITGEKTKVVFSDHHLSHVAYSYYTSPFKKATILSVDGVGEWETTSMYYGEDNNLTKIGSVSFPHSLGMLYSTITAFLGFKPNEGEYKVMGLAPYGDSSKYEDYKNEFSEGGFSVATSTAGLHFTLDMIADLQNNGHKVFFLNLDINLGTFKQIHTENIEDYEIHSEFYKVSENEFNEILNLKENGYKVVAVGTTVLRTLETVFISGIYEGKTNLFITPGYKFNIPDFLITNFHAPRSSLLSIVQTIYGNEWKKLYEYAQKNNLKFLSFGDAVLFKIDEQSKL